VSDLRFKVEYDYLKTLDTCFIQIERPNYPLLDTSKHYDLPLMSPTYTIFNEAEGDISKFHDSIKLLIEHITMENMKK